MLTADIKISEYISNIFVQELKVQYFIKLLELYYMLIYAAYNS